MGSTVLVLALAALAAAQRHGNTVSIPTDLATRPLYRDVYGYSIEPVWVNDFLSNDMTSTLLRSITQVIGKPPPIRIGGNTADMTSYVDRLNTTAVAIPAPNGAQRFNISRGWIEEWGRYFEQGTNLTFTLNMRDNSSEWATARVQAEVAWGVLGSKLSRFEIGNEVDHYMAKGWRNDSWGVDAYAQQFRQLADLIRNDAWYRDAGDKAPAFAAGSFADPPWVPDQHDQLDDMDILNLTTRAGLKNEKDSGGVHIDSFVVHMYPGSTCDAGRWRRMRLDLVSNHSSIWQNVSQYVPQVEAAERDGRASLVMGETNSISCGGRSGISDTFGGALWNVDYTLSLAAIGVGHSYFHLGGQNEYSSWQPKGYQYKGENITAGIRPSWYAHYFVAHVVRRSGGGGGDGDGDDDDDDSAEVPYGIAALPGANSSDFSGFGVFEDKELRKLVFLDMGVWNGTQGLSNPSTISAADNTDAAFHSQGDRPTSEMSVSTPWCKDGEVKILRLTGPGTNAKSEVKVSGVTFDKDGKRSGQPDEETVKVGDDGEVKFNLSMAEAVLLELGDGCGGSEAGSAAARIGAAAGGMMTWVVTVAFGVGLLVGL
ncbi:hypothetical protein MCOR27_005167 [Pyricularia oryzae]|nr:hypothetical protein MCOR01_000678 [Pyricularia oryzae]KAI6279409.1 hypothetical protein MCOR27_005167 [Pyricularia oryzae]KAI6315271.1 hypothetical protein MCOR29_007023 [Pyricularia oryzae]KAI6374154.1 hypothetical protein MCOR32_005598 [Pyricularia oryzae]KAI6504465.1 hypothetical protein MCOR11_000088 [Pyricularia oryzae]